MCVLFRKRQEENRDILCIVTGEKGDGKSNTIMQLGRHYIKMFGLRCLDCKHEWIFQGNALIKDERGIVTGFNRIWQSCPKCKSNHIKRVRELNFKYYMGYNVEEVKNKIMDLPSYSPILGDEAARWAMGEDWAKSENKDMKKLFIQIRTKRLIVFANIPDFPSIDSKYRNMANYWIRLMHRDDEKAIGIFMRKSKAEVQDKWFMKDFQKLMGHYFEDDSFELVKNISNKLKRRHPCVYDVFTIPPLPDKIYAVYEKYRNEHVFQEQKEQAVKATHIDKKHLAKVMVFNLYHDWDALLDAVRKSRNKKLTYQLIEKYLFKNPKTKKSLIKFQTAQNWEKDINNSISV